MWWLLDDSRKEKSVDVQELINQTMLDAQKLVNQYTYPVFIVDEKFKPDLIASSVIIELDSRYYLLTASHALGYVLGSNSQFLIGVDLKSLPIVGDFVYTSHDDIDHFDIAFVELSADFVRDNNVVTSPVSG